jgi:AhpD family alkylhydroperoxidase
VDNRIEADYRKPIAAGIFIALALTAMTAVVLAQGQASPSSKASPSAQGSPSPSQTSQSSRTNADQSAALADIQKTFGFVPHFLSDIPAEALPGTWEEMKTLQMNPKTLLPNKVKELIGLGVSAQIPCWYCINAHTEFSRMNGANEMEIGEAVSEAALTRHWSTFLNGMQLDEAKFRSEIKTAVANMNKSKKAGTPFPAAMPITDGASALADIRNTLGFVPEVLQRFPDNARAGAWKTMRAVEMDPGTALSGKNKNLISLGVSAQIPCSYRIIATTEFAKADGATDAEIAEAIAQAALTRQFSTLLNGMKVDQDLFKSDLARLVKGAQASRQTNTPPVR